jgi:biotin carboxylase
MDFLVIEGDFPFWRGFVVEEWRRLPHRRLLLSEVPKLWRPHDYDCVEELPRHGRSLDVDALRAIAKRFGEAAGACTVFEPAVGRTLEVQRALGLPELSRLDGRALRNKAEMTSVMSRAGLAIPATVHGTDAADVARRARERLPFPVIVKPSELAGKAGVALVRTGDALRPAIDAALAETLPFEIDGVASSVADVFGCERGVLVQEYVEGPEYSVEGFASRGRPVILAVTEKLHSGPPLFEELGHFQPARLGEAEIRSIEQYAAGACEAFGLQHCFFHLEVRLSARGPVMMEVNCRLAGDMIAKLMELRSGMNTGDVLLRLAAGEDVAPPPRWIGAAGVVMTTVPAGGTLASVRAPVLRSDRELAVFEPAPGSQVHAPKPGGVTRVGYLIAAGDDRDAIERRLGELAAETRVEIGRAPPP